MIVNDALEVLCPVCAKNDERANITYQERSLMYRYRCLNGHWLEMNKLTGELQEPDWSITEGAH
jgi:hypothetical protein